MLETLKGFLLWVLGPLIRKMWPNGVDGESE